MSDVKPTIDDEIDLFELVEILWSEKVVIGYFLAVALVVGGLTISSYETKYESIVKFKITTAPPVVSVNEVFADFHEQFHSKGNFSQWSKTMPNAQISLADVVPTIFEDGVIYGANLEVEAVVFVRENVATIRSKDAGLIRDSIKYMEFAAAELSERYVMESQEEYERLQALSDRLYERRDRGSLPATFDGLPALERLADLDTYLSRVKDGAKLIRFSLPSKPTEVGLLKKFLLAVLVMIGGVAGVLFVLVRRTYRKRKFTSANQVS